MINQNEYLIPEEFRPDWLVYPARLVDLVASGRVKLVPWHLYKAEVAKRKHERLKTRLDRELVPFAYRQDREDFACFEKGKGEMVLIIHDNTDPGYEDEGDHPTFTDWLTDAEAEAASWE